MKVSQTALLCHSSGEQSPQTSHYHTRKVLAELRILSTSGKIALDGVIGFA